MAADPSAISSLTGPQIALIAGSVGAVVAALISAGFALLNTWIVKRAENERALRELVFKYAMEMHNQHLEIAKIQGGGGVLPIDAYLVHLVAIVDVLLKERLTKENVNQLLDQVQEIVKSSSDHLLATRDYRKKQDTTQ